MVTVVKTITEHTNGRREKQDGTGWERRVGTRPVPGRTGRRPLMETVWEDCEAPKTYVYGSPAHQAAREAGKGGGTVDYVWEGLDTIEPMGPFTREEAEWLLRHYAAEFSAEARYSIGDLLVSGDKRERSKAEALRRAREVASRVKVLFGLDLWETNLAD